MSFERALKAWKRNDPSRASAKNWLDIDRPRPADRRLPRVDGPIEQLDDEHAERHGAQIGGLEQDRGLSPEPASVSQRDREIVALRFGGDRTGPEIAELLGRSLANVQQVLSRSLRRLRAELDPAA